MILKLIGAAVIGVLLILVVRKSNPEQGFMLSIAAVCVLSFVAAAALSGVIGYLRELAESAGFSGAMLETLLKVLGISIIIRITGELCRDAKEQGIAATLDIGGTILIVYVSLPLFTAVLDLLKSMLPMGG